MQWALRWLLDQFWPLVVRCGSVPWKTNAGCFAEMSHVSNLYFKRNNSPKHAYLNITCCLVELFLWLCEQFYLCESAVLCCSVCHLVVGKLDAVLFSANLYWLLHSFVVISMGLCRYSLLFYFFPPSFFYFPLHFPLCSLVYQIEMAIETLQKSEGLSSQRSSLLNSHVSHKNMTMPCSFRHCPPPPSLFLRSVCFSLFRWWGLGSFFFYFDTFLFVCYIISKDWSFASSGGWLGK